MSENKNQEDYFRETIETFQKLKGDLQLHGRLMDTTGITPALFKEFRINFKQMVSAGDYFFEVADYPKFPEQLEKEQRQMDRAKSSRVEPLTKDQYEKALWLEKKGLSFAQIAKYLTINEKEFRRSWNVSVQLYETTQHILDKVAQTPEGEQDFVLKAQPPDFWGRQAKPVSLLPVLNQVRIFLKQGMKPKEVAEKLGYNVKSFESWLKANQKYLDL